MTGKLRILYTIPNFDTAGSGKALLNIAEGLDKSRFEPMIMCMHDRGQLFNKVRESGLKYYLLDYTTAMRPYHRGLTRCYKISRVFRQIRPDLIHSFHYAADYSESIAAKMAGIKWIYTKKNMNWGGSSKNGWRIRTLLASGIIAQNSDMMREFFNGSTKTILIPRGVSTAEFAPKAADLSIKVDLGLKPDDSIIISVANLVPVKGIEVLMNAFFEIANQIPEWRIMIVGDNNNKYGRLLKKIVTERGIDDKVIFTGKVPDVSDYLNLAEVFVLPTLDKGEGFPVSLLEAMANGKIVLGSAVPGIKDQLQEFPDLLFEPGNCLQLSNKLLHYCRMTVEHQHNLKNEIMAHVQQRYPIVKEVEEHMKFYLDLVSHG